MVCVHESRIKRDLEKSVNSHKAVVNSSSKSLDRADSDNDESDSHMSRDDDFVDHSHDSGEGHNSEDKDAHEKAIGHESDCDSNEDTHEQVSDTDNNSVENVDNPGNISHNDQVLVENVNRSKQLGSNNRLKFKENDVIKFQVGGETNTREATILSRAGKASTNKKDWYNIEYMKPDSLKGDKISIDLSTVQNLHNVDTEHEGDRGNSY